MKRPTSLFRAAFLGIVSLMPLSGALHAEPLPLVTIQECVRASLSANHPLLGRAAESDAARERAMGASAARRPKLFLLANAQHTDDPLRLAPATANNQPGVFTRNTWQTALGVSLPLYTGGRLTAEQNAANLLAEAASGDLIYARQALAVRVVALYQDVLALHAVIRSLDQSRATLISQTESINALIGQQKAAEVDILRVSVRLASVEQFLIEARNRLDVLKATIFVLMGRQPSAQWAPADSLVIPPRSTERVVATRSLRADEIAARARTAAAEEQVRAARAGYRPSVDAIAGYGTRADFDSGKHEESGFVGVQLTWNIWDFDRTRSRVGEAEAKLRVLDEAEAETALQRNLELSNAEAGIRSAAAKIEASRLAVEQSRESLRIEQKKYELGQGTITDVLAAQTASDEAESLRARALADHAIALAARDFAAGTIFTSAAATPALQFHDNPGPSADHSK